MLKELLFEGGHRTMNPALVYFGFVGQKTKKQQTFKGINDIFCRFLFKLIFANLRKSPLISDCYKFVRLVAL
jgi:hypothetical protein